MSSGNAALAENCVNPAKLLTASAVLGLWATLAGAAELRPEDAVRHSGETATVCGVVASANVRGQCSGPADVLDLGEPSPHAVFTAVIYRNNRPKFGTPETSLRGQRICVTRQISDYGGKPEIVLTDPGQLSQ
jgi:hypothetical protein